jgi:hypothetical protein
MEAIQLPPSLISNPIVLLLIFAGGGILKELVVGVMRGLVKKWRADKDPSNDALADGLEGAANAVDKLGPLKLK